MQVRAETGSGFLDQGSRGACFARTRPSNLFEGKLLPLEAPTAAELNLKDGQVIQGLVKLHDDQPALF